MLIDNISLRFISSLNWDLFTFVQLIKRDSHLIFPSSHQRTVLCAPDAEARCSSDALQCNDVINIRFEVQRNSLMENRNCRLAAFHKRIFDAVKSLRSELDTKR